MRRAILVLLPFAVAACPPPVIAPEETGGDSKRDTDPDTELLSVDEDGDGFTDCRPGDDPKDCDCDDDNFGVHPGVEEIWYDGVDQDCDGNDADKDGDDHVWWGMNQGTDCDDNNHNIHPEAGEDEPYDGVDWDCDRRCDYDADGDGEAAPAAEHGGTYANNSATPWDGTFIYCEDGFDCDDSDASVYTGAAQVFDAADNDCDGETERLSLYEDTIQVVGPQTNSGWGTDLLTVDIDGDGHDEVWAGADGLVVGLDGAFLSTWTGGSVSYAGGSVKIAPTADFPNIGAQQVLGDLDRDGTPELLMGTRDTLHRDVLVMADTELSGSITADALTLGIAGGTTYSLLGGDLLVMDGANKTVVVAGNPGGGEVLAYYASGVSAGTTDDQAHLIIKGAATLDNFGSALAGVDILNDDGLPDLLIGSPGDDVVASAGGAVYVLDGSLIETGTTRDNSTLFRIDGDQSGHRFGMAIEPVGDFNGDGTPDVAIASKSGSVTWRLVEGGDTTIFNLGSSQIAPAIKVDGESVAIAHADLDGDGKSEVIVGDGSCVYGYSGQALFEGGSFSTSNAQAKVCDTSVSDFAHHVALGDVTADGSMELIVASPNDTSGANGLGAVYILQTGSNWDL